MLKKILLAVLVALPMMVSAQTVKIGLVDANAVMASLPAYTEATTKLETIAKNYEEESRKLQAELQRLYEEYQAMGQDALPAIRERKEQDIVACQQKIESFNMKAREDLNRQQEAEMSPIMASVQNAIQSVGKEGGYAIIQDLAAVYFYGAPAEDITAAVKAKLGVK